MNKLKLLKIIVALVDEITKATPDKTDDEIWAIVKPILLIIVG